MMPFEQDILATHPDNCPVDDEPMARAAHAAAPHLLAKAYWHNKQVRFPASTIGAADIIRWLILQAKDPAHIIVRIPGTEGLLPTSNP